MGGSVTHRRLANCHAMVDPPGRDALAEAPHAPTTALDGAAIITTTSAISTITIITTNHSDGATGTDTQPLMPWRFRGRYRADTPDCLVLELGCAFAEVGVQQGSGDGAGPRVMRPDRGVRSTDSERLQLYFAPRHNRFWCQWEKGRLSRQRTCKLMVHFSASAYLTQPLARCGL